MDRNDFAAKVVAQTDRMYRIAYVLLHNNEDCRDAMQEAALKAWEKRFTLRDPKYFTTWLTRILINECRNIQRKQKRIIVVDEVSIPAVPVQDPTLSITLQSLPEKLRLPLLMHAMEGMTYDEISQTLRLPRSTVIGRVQRAKQQLRKELEV